MSWALHFMRCFILKNSMSGVPLWCSRLRIQHFQCSSLGPCFGTGLIPGHGISTCCRCGQKKIKKNISCQLALILITYIFHSWRFTINISILKSLWSSAIIFKGLYLSLHFPQNPFGSGISRIFQEVQLHPICILHYNVWVQELEVKGNLVVYCFTRG